MLSSTGRASGGRVLQVRLVVTFATEINPADLQQWVDASAKYKLIAQRFPASEVYLRG